jgi:hypothetical protein
MNSAMKWAFGLLGAVAVAAAPFVLHVSVILFVLCVLIVCVWAFWLMLEYLRWAKTLRRK